MGCDGSRIDIWHPILVSSQCISFGRLGFHLEWGVRTILHDSEDEGVLQETDD